MVISIIIINVPNTIYLRLKFDFALDTIKRTRSDVVDARQDNLIGIAFTLDRMKFPREAS